MKSTISQKGFSLIELLLVVTIIGIIASLAIPSLRKGLIAAENGSTNATMKIILSAQTMFYAQKGRYARLDEINAFQGNLGQTSGNQLIRGKFTYEMIPASPTDIELKDGFEIKATRTIGIPAGDPPYVVIVDQRGYPTEILP